MRTNIVIDDNLMNEALKVSDLKTKKRCGGGRFEIISPAQKTREYQRPARKIALER